MIDAMLPMILPMAMEQLRNPEAQAQIANMIADEFERAGVVSFEVQCQEGKDAWMEHHWLHDGLTDVLSASLARFDVELAIGIELIPGTERRRFVARSA